MIRSIYGLYNEQLVDSCLAPVGRKRKVRQPGPKPQVRSEVPQPLFYKTWDYSADPIFGPICEEIQSGVPVEGYFLTDLRLVYQIETGHKYCVPRSISVEVILAYHSQCHPGVPKLLSLLGRRYIFSLTMKELHKACSDVCHHCQVCQAVKPRKGQVPGTMDFFPIPQEIFSSLCMDFVDLEPCKGTDGCTYDYCLVIVCRLSGYIVAIPCKKDGLTAKKVAQLFL